jgi:hypothetical protein
MSTRELETLAGQHENQGKSAPSRRRLKQTAVTVRLVESSIAAAHVFNQETGAAKVLSWPNQSAIAEGQNEP